MTRSTAYETAQLVSRLRFRHLQLMTELKRGGSLRAAAQVLNLTQPALSKALGEIESAFGFALFTRTARGVTPTASGEVAIRGAGLLLQELAHVRNEAAAGAGVTAIVRIGAPPFVAQGYLPQVLKLLCSHAPPLRVQLLEERVPLLVQALIAGEVDALVTSYPAQMPHAGAPALVYEKLFDAEFHIIAPPGHALARARQVTWQRLAQEPWVMPAPASMVRRVIEESFMRAGAVPPVPIVESTSPVTNVQLVAAGLGLSATPAATARHAISLGQVKRVRATPEIAPGPVALIYRAGVENPRVQLLRAALAARA
ncbi:MAG: LysR family transcriptional regulator [Bdellovibrionales bacterium]|nr:LysR family transcriptional regulator [Ramlibacter sp.]